MEKGWADLPVDLLLHILNSENLTVLDIIYFSAVCTSWQFTAKISKYRRNIRYQSPWLMFVEQEDPNSAQLYSFSTNKLHRIPNQPDSPIANRIFIGSAHGWLITADERSELSLLNPITRQQIELPSVSTFENVHPFHRPSDNKFYYYILRNRRGSIVHYTAENLRHTFYYKATLSSFPTAGDYVVALLLYQTQGFAFARAGDKKWTMIENVNVIDDITFLRDGKVYTTDWRGSIEAWDLNTKDCSSIKPELVFHKPLISIKMMYFFYLVCAPCGGLLLVRRDGDYDGEYLNTKRIKTWKIQLGETKKFTKLTSLGDYALFLGGTFSSCVSSKEIPEIRGNCVYLTDEYKNRGSRRDVCIVNLEDESVEPILANDPRLNWPSPIWVTPSLT